MKTRVSIVWVIALIVAAVVGTYYIVESRDADIEIDLPEVEIDR